MDKVKAQLEKDKIERYGQDYVDKTQNEIKPVHDVFKEIYGKMRKIYLGDPDAMRTCFKTLLVYLGIFFNVKI